MTAAPAKVSVAYKSRWLGLLFICISVIVVSLDNTILNVALPSIARDLEASATDLQWIVDSYILVFASFLLTIGTLGDHHGRKRALQIGLLMFGIGSLWAAEANSVEMLIAARAFLGIAGATILPATLALISSTFSDKERPGAIASWSAIYGLGIGIGPVLGGWLIERYAWNSVFLVNLPIIAVALVGGHFLVAESKDPHAPKVDVPGAVLSMVGMFALVYAIIEAGVHGWTNTNVILAFGVAVWLLGSFVWWERRAPHPMLPMELFRNRSFSGANIALVLISFSLLGAVFFLSQYFQSVLGYSPLDAGLRILPTALSLVVAAGLSSRIARLIGTKYTVAIGTALAATALLVMSTTYRVDSPYSVVVVGQILIGVGLGLAISPSTNSVMGSVPVEKAGIGSAMNDTTRQLGGALGIAVLGTLLNNVYLDRIRPLLVSVQETLERIPLALVSEEQRAQALEAIQRGIQGAMFVVERVGSNPLAASMAGEVQTTARAAFVDGMTHAMFVGALIMYVAAVLVLVLLPAQVQATEPGDLSL